MQAFGARVNAGLPRTDDEPTTDREDLVELLLLMLVMGVPLGLTLVVVLLVQAIRRHRAGRYARMVDTLEDDGVADVHWREEADRLARLPAEARAAEVRDRIATAREALDAAWDRYNDAGFVFAAGAAIRPAGRRTALRKSELYARARALLPAAVDQVQLAVAGVAAVHQARRDGTRLAHLLDALPAPTTGEVSWTGAQATRSLKARFDALHRVLQSLEDALDPHHRRSAASVAFHERQGIGPIAASG